MRSPLSWPALLTASPILINFISLSVCLMSGNSFPTRAQTTRKVIILLDLLKSVKQFKFQLKYEFFPYYSISFLFKIVIHRAEFSTLLSQITLLKMWRLGPLQKSWLRIHLKKNFPVSMIKNLSYVTRVEHWKINILMLP